MNIEYCCGQTMPTKTLARIKCQKRLSHIDLIAAPFLSLGIGMKFVADCKHSTIVTIIDQLNNEFS